jgi:glutamate-ammonia-ligase adenylyltransferase
MEHFKALVGNRERFGLSYAFQKLDRVAVSFRRGAREPTSPPLRGVYNRGMPSDHAIDLPALEAADVALDGFIEAIHFANPSGMAALLRRVTGQAGCASLVTALLPFLREALLRAPDPDRTLVSFERFVGRFPEAHSILELLANNPRAVEILGVLFSNSHFLTEILLRNPETFERLVAYRRMARPKGVEQLFTEAQAALDGVTGFAAQLDALRRFQSWEQLRIGACDLLDLYDLPAVTRQLSNLADAMIRACLKLAAAQSGGRAEMLTVLGMGKLGGRELNYSSDIDLIFLSEDDPQITQRMAERLIDALARATPEGFLYRVDMRLRPWGSVGPLVASLAGFRTYLKKNAQPWEKQALLKARAVAGDLHMGRALLEESRVDIFNLPTEALRPAVFSMKQRTEAQLRQNGRAWGEVKLGEGSIRDVEFTAQFLQLAYGAKHPEIITGNTLEALVRLASAELIDLEEMRILTEGYVFLRTIEHFLQMMDYRQTHSLPPEPQALAALARRLGFTGERPGDQFLERYEQHGAAIRAVFLRYVGGYPMQPASQDQPPQSARREEDEAVQPHVDRMAPSYAEMFSATEIARHAALAARLSPDHPVEVHALARDGETWRVTVVAYDYPGELSVLAGLLFVYGLNIVTGEAFTYQPLAKADPGAPHQDERRKIVDVFDLQPVEGTVSANTWRRYAADLEAYQRLIWSNKRREMQGDLTRRVASALHGRESVSGNAAVPALYPIAIELDNEASEQHTVLRIDAADTAGFLYEFTNALAISGVEIDQVVIDTVGSRVQDVIFVTDRSHRKIVEAEKQRELRSATVLIKHFTHLLPFSPNPEAALVHFREFIDQLFRRPNWPDELASVQRPEVLQGLARLLGVSDFLWDDFLRMQYANLFPVVTNMAGLETAKSKPQLQAELGDALADVHAGPQPPNEDAPWIEVINAWRDREMFRIDMRHILGQTSEFWDFAAELTDLAEVIANAAFHLCHEDLRLAYGTPRLEDGSPCQMSVVALGKFGGFELGFASDIELMFIYEGNGLTDGPRQITMAEFYEKLVVAYVAAMRTRREGIFEVDLQLRPYGKAGSLAVSLDSFRRYFGPAGPAWAYERQALVRLRPVAGDEALGERIAHLRDEYIYGGEPFDVTSMRAMRERQLRHLVKGGAYNLKYSLGGLVDVEYLVQGLQMAHGGQYPELRETNTREAMAALAAVGVCSAEDYVRLRKAHTFLRWLIDSLRVVRGNARDVTVPAEVSEEYAYLARRLRYGDPATLHKELLRYTEDVREINARLLK